MCGHALSPSQTAGCLSQVIFVKQLLFSEFLLGIIIIIWPTTQCSQFGERGRGGGGGRDSQNLPKYLET